MSCQVCNIREKRYKCSTCLVPFCSVGCYKTHKLVNCQPIQPVDQNETIKQPSYNYVTDSTVPAHKLKLLEGNEELKSILQNPHIRNMLLAIDNSKNPSEDMDHAMHEPIFVEFVDECLKVVEPMKEQ